MTRRASGYYLDGWAAHRAGRSREWAVKFVEGWSRAARKMYLDGWDGRQARSGN